MPDKNGYQQFIENNTGRVFKCIYKNVDGAPVSPRCVER
jgi:hypothetical protein